MTRLKQNYRNGDRFFSSAPAPLTDSEEIPYSKVGGQSRYQETPVNGPGRSQEDQDKRWVVPYEASRVPFPF